ncbi:MAG: class I SAM-dependent methyltransferase, partial [Planctomycetes bacterium]|nr:class I SAM-dependent methyltransferase [Planctomycetota bacterium]
KHANHAGEFDVVIANDVIEHVSSPRLFLTHLRSVLRPGGWLSLETPNWGGIWRRVGGPRWLGLNPFHVFLFDARCLTRLMAQCGFRDCRAGSSTNCAHAAWGSRPELHPLWQCLPAALRWRLERFLDRLTPPSFALALRHDSPPSIEDALTRIEIVRRPTAMPSARLTGDNLMVIGRA